MQKYKKSPHDKLAKHHHFTTFSPSPKGNWYSWTDFWYREPQYSDNQLKHNNLQSFFTLSLPCILQKNIYPPINIKHHEKIEKNEIRFQGTKPIGQGPHSFPLHHHLCHHQLHCVHSHLFHLCCRHEYHGKIYSRRDNSIEQ